MIIYEVSLCIRTSNSDSKLSYYERWLIDPVSYAPHLQPILDTVFKRDCSVSPEPQDQWYVLVGSAEGSKKHAPAAVFEKGRKLIRDYLKSSGFNTSNLAIKD